MRIFTIKPLYPLLLGLSVFLCTCALRSTEELINLNGNIFGTQYKILYVATKETAPKEPIHRLVMTRLQEIDNLMSTWNKESELSSFNRLSVNEPMKVSNELIRILSLSKEMHLLSKGTFDVTVGPLVNLWGFGPQGDTNQLPREAAIAAAGRNIGMQHLHIDEKGLILRKSVPLYVDLSAIAKGYAADQVGEVLKKQGIGDYLVEIGGELSVHGRKPNGAKWRIAIEKPQEHIASVYKTIELENLGMATSGDYRNYYEREGVRYSHTIDPRTLRPVRHKLASASVIHENAAVADALATALMVMGTEKAKQFAAEQNLAIYLITRRNKELIDYASPAFIKLIP